MQMPDSLEKQWQSFGKWFRPKQASLNFESVQKRENELLTKRRTVQREKGRLKRFPADASNIANDSVGLCLSGGGVRSATFNLGVLQALDRYEFLPRVDYLSTVSGGGYIGSSLVWFQTRDKVNHDFPFRRYVRHHPPEETTKGIPSSDAIIEWLRRHASYLTPGDGLNMWALFAAVARGTIINLLITVPILFGLIFLSSWPVSISNKLFGTPDVEAIDVTSTLLRAFQETLHRLQWGAQHTIDTWINPALSTGIAFGIAQIAAVLLAIYLFLRIVYYATLSRKSLNKSGSNDFAEHRAVSEHAGLVLRIIVFLAVFGYLPVIQNLLAALIGESVWRAEIVTAVSSIVGVASIIIGWASRKGKNETAGWRAFLIKFGLAIVLYLLILWFYVYAERLWHPSVDRSGLFGAYSAFAVAFSIYLGFVANINRVSMHRYYRNRLLECYLPDTPPPPGQSESEEQNWDAETFGISEVSPEDTGNPCLIINANLTTLKSRVPRYRIRGGHNFTFTPWHIGSDAMGTRDNHMRGWVKCKSFLDGMFPLATALAISGAAVDPNTGATRYPPLAFIMGFLNVRLGFWIRNPVKAPSRFNRWPESPTFWHWYALREMLGIQMHEDQSYLHLSDGGHFENLGIYELIRRKCRYIIVSDSGGDPDFKFLDLARAVERVRVDFHADIDIGTSPLKPDGEPKTSSQAIAVGTVTYEDGSSGKIIYLKSTVVAGLPKDIDGYQSTHSTFPHETTINQFFSDLQFEAYRELGFRLASRIFEIGGERKRSLDELFDINTSHELVPEPAEKIPA
jgi:hypothetical protein